MARQPINNGYARNAKYSVIRARRLYTNQVVFIKRRPYAIEISLNDKLIGLSTV